MCNCVYAEIESVDVSFYFQDYGDIRLHQHLCRFENLDGGRNIQVEKVVYRLLRYYAAAISCCSLERGWSFPRIAPSPCFATWACS